MADCKRIKCSWCNGTGKYKRPNDEGAYNKAFERYDKIAIFSMNKVREKALADVGYTEIECPECGGSGWES